MPQIEQFPHDPALAAPTPLARDRDRERYHQDANQIAQEEPQSSARILSYYWRVVLYYKWSILGVALIAAMLGGLSALRAVPLYQSDTRLLIRATQPNVSGFQQFDASPMYWMFYETQVDILRSRAVAERVVDRLPSPSVPSSAGAAAEPARGGGGWRAAIGDSLDENVPGWRDWRDWLPAEWRAGAGPALSPVSPRDAAVGRVLAGLRVSGGQESEVLVIGFVSTDPVEAADIANATAEAYIEFGLESRLSSANKATSWLGQRLAELRTKLSESEQALSQFQARTGLVDTRNRENIISARLGSLTTELIRAQTRSTEAGARYNQLRDIKDRGASQVAVALIVENPLVMEAHRNVADLEGKVHELSERYGEKHPKMIAVRGDLAESQRRLSLEVTKSIEGSRKEYEVAKAQEAKLHNYIEEQQSEMHTLSGDTFELAKLEREVEANQNLYEAFLDRSKEADVAQDYDVTNVRILDRAQVPRVPFAPDKRRMMVSALFLGLVFGLGIALLRHHLDRTFKSTADIEAELDLPVLGTLRRLKRRRGVSPERVAQVDPSSAFSEAVNDVRTAVQFSRIDDPPRVLLVTSALAGEGKTTLASNLALAQSKRGRTLLVDGDLRKGRVHDLARLNRSPGVTDFLSGDATLDEAIFADEEFDRLHLMPSGTVPPNPLEVISSAKFSRMLAEVRARYDYVIVDGSPLLAVSDSLVLGHLVDGVVLVVRAGKTTHDAARDALKRLGGAGIRPLGAVLQQVDLKRMHSYSYRYAQYNSGYYGYTYGRES